MLHKVDESEERGFSYKGLRKPLTLAFLFIALCLIGVILWMTLFNGSDFSLLSIFSGSVPTIDSIAVLPLENLSGDPDQDYFTEGMHDALITELSKISALRVISRPSVMRLKNSDKPIPEIAKELDVKGIVAGSTLQDEGRVKITVQLIEAETERNLWAEKYDRDYREILKLHSQVAQDIAREIRIKLTPEEKELLAQNREINPEAHKAYLLGYFHRKKMTGQSLRKSIEYFKKAIEIDPNYALAYARLSRSYAYLTLFTATEPEKAFPKAKAAALKALEIDNALSDGHFELAWVLATYDWDWEGAEREFKRAIELSPHYLTSYGTYGWFLAWMGRFDEAIALIRRGWELNPLELGMSRVLGAVLYCAGLYDQAIEELSRVLDLNPYYHMAHADLGRIYVQKGMYKEAIAEFQEAVALSKDSEGSRPEYRSILGHAYAVSGNREEALEILKELLEESKQMYVSPLSIGQLYLGLGMNKEAFEWLERAYAVRDGNLCLLKVWPIWDPLRSDPRFQDLMRRMNFPE